MLISRIDLIHLCLMDRLAELCRHNNVIYFSYLRSDSATLYSEFHHLHCIISKLSLHPETLKRLILRENVLQIFFKVIFT